MRLENTQHFNVIYRFIDNTLFLYININHIRTQLHLFTFINTNATNGFWWNTAFIPKHIWLLIDWWSLVLINPAATLYGLSIDISKKLEKTYYSGNNEQYILLCTYSILIIIKKKKKCIILLFCSNYLLWNNIFFNNLKFKSLTFWPINFLFFISRIGYKCIDYIFN